MCVHDKDNDALVCACGDARGLQVVRGCCACCDAVRRFCICILEFATCTWFWLICFWLIDIPEC